MMRRLFTVSETALATVRARTFRHIHDLSMLHQQSERRGALVSRVTSDVDQITQFLQWGGVILLVSAGQIVVTTVVMAGLLVAARRWWCTPRSCRWSSWSGCSSAGWPPPTATVRTRVGVLLGAVSESVVGAEVIRAYGVAGRTGGPARRGDREPPGGPDARAADQRHRRSPPASSRPALATAAVVVVGVLLGVGGQLRSAS